MNEYHLHMKIPKEVFQQFKDVRGFSLRSARVFTAWSGSRSYGTQIVDPNAPVQSDYDVMMVAIPPPERVYGLNRWETPYQIQHEEWDVTVYPIHQFFRLLLNGNPSLACNLWSDRKSITYKTDSFNKVLHNREAFSSLKLVRAFIGYARGQFHKMELDRDMPTGDLGEKRKKLVETFGYDTKNAGHLVRLLIKCAEFVVTSKIQVFRTVDAPHLRDIRSGKFTLAEVKTEAEGLFEKIQSLLPFSTLPESPNSELAEQLLMDCYDEHWGTNDYPGYQ